MYVFGSGRCGCRGGSVNEKIGFGLYQSCGDRGSVRHVSVFWLRWWGVGRGLKPGSGSVDVVITYPSNISILVTNQRCES